MRAAINNYNRITSDKFLSNDWLRAGFVFLNYLKIRQARLADGPNHQNFPVQEEIIQPSVLGGVVVSVLKELNALLQQKFVR